LRVENNRTGILPWGGTDIFALTNAFVIVLTDLEANAPGDLKLEIFADVNAIRRHPDGEIFNCLDTLARDSMYILGRAYAPPVTFTGLTMRVQPTEAVSVSNPYYVSQIPVTQQLPVRALIQMPEPGQPPLSIQIQENRLTRVTVTCNLDSTLIRRIESFEYRPYFYVSSIQTF
jgi:hypothetical protein